MIQQFHHWAYSQRGWNQTRKILALFMVAKYGLNLCFHQWMKKMWHIYTTGYYSGVKEEWNPVIYSNLERTQGHYIMWNKTDTEKQIHIFSHSGKWTSQSHRRIERNNGHQTAERAKRRGWKLSKGGEGWKLSGEERNWKVNERHQNTDENSEWFPIVQLSNYWFKQLMKYFSITKKEFEIPNS
jgi:hypothetical protein